MYQNEGNDQAFGFVAPKKRFESDYVDPEEKVINRLFPLVSFKNLQKNEEGIYEACLSGCETNAYIEVNEDFSIEVSISEDLDSEIKLLGIKGCIVVKTGDSEDPIIASVKAEGIEPVQIPLEPNKTKVFNYNYIGGGKAILTSQDCILL